MKDCLLEIEDNRVLAQDVFEMKLAGDVGAITTPGMFVNLKINGLFLRRPISVCDVNGNILTLIYKRVGRGTQAMSAMRSGEKINALTGLGNGYDLSACGDAPLLIGGGVGVPPLYLLAKRLISQGKSVSAVLGFGSRADVFYEKEFCALGCRVTVTTLDGSQGEKGLVTEYLPEKYSYFYACGPEPMLRAVYAKTETDGQFSLEERMGCGFGACMGCSCKTANGSKRICKDGPVFQKGELLWER